MNYLQMDNIKTQRFETFTFEKYCDLETRKYCTVEIRVRGHSRSSTLVPFDSLYNGFLLVSYTNFVSKMHRFFTYSPLKCTVTVKPGLESLKVA